MAHTRHFFGAIAFPRCNYQLTPNTQYGRVISFVVTGDDDDEALRRTRNACENLRVINFVVSLGGGASNLCASIRSP